jgi:uncharacterized protein (TIGR03437 family)
MRLFLAVLFLSAPLLAQNCDYSVLPAALNIQSGASTGQISVTTGSNCAWSISNSTLTWLHFDIVQGTGSGVVNYSADANPTAQQRTGTISVATKQVSVTQAAAQCSYALDSTSQTIGGSGGNGSFKVTTGCIWQPGSTRQDFITVQDPGTVRLGNATVNYTVGANPCVYGRQGAIVINTTSTGAAPTYTINQDGSPTNLTLSATSISAGPDASDGRITVTTGQGCVWSASSDVTWLQLLGSAAGAGNGAISYHLLANTVAPRTGTIRVGSLVVTVTQAALAPSGPSLASVNSAANYRNDAVSPGEIVTLFGSNLGPATLAPLQVAAGSVTNSLAGTQVLFDGTPAPLIYTVANQVSAVVPYGVAGKDSTKIQVTYNGATSNTVTMPVQAAHPGIFTLDASGLGPGAILNQDTTINSSANGAARGSIVAIYATGGGVTRPALADGAVTGNDLPFVTQPVTVTIGGIDARVAYAGGVPGAVAGLTQINAEIPAGVTPSNGVPIVIKIGNYPSAPGVTISVR